MMTRKIYKMEKKNTSGRGEGEGAPKKERKEIGVLKRVKRASISLI